MIGNNTRVRQDMFLFFVSTKKNLRRNDEGCFQKSNYFLHDI